MLIPTCLIKFLELSLTIACLTLHHYSYDLTDIPTLMLCSGTYVGYVVVLSGEIVGEILLAPLDLVQDMYFCMVGVGLFGVSGGLVLSARTKGSPYPRTGDHNAALIAGEAVSATADAYIDAWWSAIGGVLFGACGALTLHGWRDVPFCQRKNYAQTYAVCSLAVAALMTIDALIALCSAQKDDVSTRSKSTRRAA
ncbi:unnamed protein product [Pieris macdunnoughi]|uniref:Uncharacterized protein n=1 Tax=Pieris macdunnoughi TaxID=345717 RepID=A0A821RV43_9NEOP|nr:unnamed protein product [Pieris macdunnoughi]